MANGNKRSLSPYQVSIINTVLSNGERVELIPVKDGVRVIHVRREEVK